MPEPLELAKKLKSSLEEGAMRLRVLRPYRDLEGSSLGEKGEKIQTALMSAKSDFESLMAMRRDKPKELQKAALSDSILGRIGFNIADCLGRAGITAASHEVLDLMDSILKGEDSLAARLLTRYNLFLLTLGKGDYLEAVESYKRLYALGNAPKIWRALAASAFYLCVLSLREGSQKTAEDIYQSFVSERDDILRKPTTRVQELPLALVAHNRLNKKEEIAPDAPLTEADFPLGLTLEGDRLLKFLKIEELQAPHPEDSPTDILARIGTILSVWHGEHRSMEMATRYFDSISLWGNDHGPMLERARCATFLIFYLGPDCRGALDIYEKTFPKTKEPLSPDIAMEKAKCTINLVFSCGASGNTQMAMEYFHNLSAKPEAHEDPILYAKAALNLITAMASKGQTLEAQKVYDSVSEWGSGWEVKIVRLKAVRCLINFYAKGGQMKEAKALFKSMDKWDGGEELFLLKSKAGLFLMEVLEKNKDLPGAKEVFNTLRWKKGYLEEDLNRLVAARSLINLYLAEDDPQSALDIYRSFSPGGDHERLDLERGRLAVNLILSLGKAEMLKQARGVYNSLENLTRTKDMELLRAKAAVNFVAACEAASDARKAHVVYDKLEYREDNLVFAREKAKAAVTLVGLYGKLGLPHKGRDLFYAMPNLEDPEYRLLKHAVGVNLVTAFAMADRWAEALDSATEVVSDGMTEEMREELLKKLNFLMSKTVNYPKKEELNILGLFSDD
ncbi:MAG: hypothetical protein LBE27_07825 [Deltaproteobacteria bacterium]|nr:hypothetical protein [Deltaproteobacteria bacterium]